MQTSAKFISKREKYCVYLPRDSDALQNETVLPRPCYTIPPSFMTSWSELFCCSFKNEFSCKCSNKLIWNIHETPQQIIIHPPIHPSKMQSNTITAIWMYDMLDRCYFLSTPFVTPTHHYLSLICQGWTSKVIYKKVFFIATDSPLSTSDGNTRQSSSFSRRRWWKTVPYVSLYHNKPIIKRCLYWFCSIWSHIQE